MEVRGADSERDMTPYSFENFPGWERAQHAYEQGLKSWCSDGLPTAIMGNLCFARMHVELLWERVMKRPQAQRQEALHVLELGAGNARFAWFFLWAWRERCQALETEERPGVLHYYASDRHAAALQSLAQNPHFGPVLSGDKSVRLWPCIASLESSELHHVHGRELELPGWDMLIMQYLWCQLPARCISWREGGYWEQFLSPVALERPEGEEAKQAGTGETVSANSQSTPQTRNAWRLSEQPLSENDPLFQESDILACLPHLPREWVMLAPAALRGLRYWSQGLKADGLLLISDKARRAPSLTSWPLQEHGHGAGEAFEPEPEHPRPSGGPYYSYTVHFEVLQAVLQAVGFKVRWRPHALWAVQSLLAVKAPGPELEDSFLASFVEDNANQLWAESVDSAEQAWQADNYRKAAVHYLQALQGRPGEARLLNRLVACLLELQDFSEARRRLLQPRLDPDDDFDWDFQWGQLHLFSGDYVQAVAAFELSLERHGAHESTYYNLGLAHVLNADAQRGRECFVLALEHKPDDLLAQEALATWDDSFT